MPRVHKRREGRGKIVNCTIASSFIPNMYEKLRMVVDDERMAMCNKRPP